MKLPLPPAVLFLFVTSTAALAVTLELCLQPQKNQPHWLASSTSGLNISPLAALLLPAFLLLHSASLPSAHYSNSK